MALSVLTLGDEKKAGLYSSVEKKFIHVGDYETMFQIKHQIESLEQKAANEEHLENLKKEYINIIMGLGYTEEGATSFLQQTMPNLFK